MYLNKRFCSLIKAMEVMDGVGGTIVILKIKIMMNSGHCCKRNGAYG